MSHRSWLLAAGLSALVIASTGCDRNPELLSSLQKLEGFSNDVQGKIKTAPNLSAGVDEGQKVMTARKEEMRTLFRRLESIRDQGSDDTRGKLTDGLLKISNGFCLDLKLNNLDAVAKDQALETKLEKLCADWNWIIEPLPKP